MSTRLSKNDQRCTLYFTLAVLLFPFRENPQNKLGTSLLLFVKQCFRLDTLIMKEYYLGGVHGLY